jgi:hypothetical protein
MQRNIWSNYIFKDQKISVANSEEDTNQVIMDVIVQDLMTWNIVDKVGLQRNIFWSRVEKLFLDYHSPGITI